MPSGSGNKRLETGVPPEEFETLDPAVEPENVARALDDQIDQHAAIDEVIVDDEVVGVLDERPIHVRKPVDDHQQHAEARRHAHHQAGEQRQADQQMAVLDHECRDRRHGRRGEHHEDVMPGLCVGQEADNTETWHENLVRSGVEEGPRHDEAEVKNQTFFHR
jgi:hypothetical protein